ncbi:MAG: T9SS type A sorting domain-containing protein [Bacteroidetes bacterium]|jgi:subtilisin-like proprotein convertase family protein|nr:T9SS type A sorting domain-containing protein [Bacteroidota bacterium]
MSKQLLIIAICVFTFSLSNAQRNYWNAVDIESENILSDQIINYNIDIKKADYFKLDKAGVSFQLSSAPNRSDANTSNVVLEIPSYSGEMESFEMFKVQTLSSSLAANYPEIQSFVGKSTNSRDASVLKVTITPQGFYAMVLEPDVGQYFINPYDKDGQYYMSFLKSFVTDNTHPNCEFINDNSTSEIPVESAQNQEFIVDDSTLRTYDLALACTGEYAQFHISQAGLGGAPQPQQIAAVLAAMTVTMDRVNSIYERDFGVNMQLIPNTDLLIFLNANTDPYTNNNGGAMLTQNQIEVNSTIGAGNYDIGHVFSTGGGGIAGLGVVCINSQKARGVTGSPNPVGDPFDIDFVAHEMGHQFGANHTQNNDCQRNNATAVEPGSANTIMGYAGICPPNVQNNSDAHFHQISIDEIFSNLSSGPASTCGVFTTQSNTAPSLTPVSNKTIPNGTAFYLDIDAVDAENDALTYNWEQINNGIAIPDNQPPSPTSTVGPNFRSLPSKTESRRYFPDFNDVLNNNLTPTWEVIPSVARNMNFAVTVRDNNVQVGQSSRDIVTVNFANVGPFQVTSQNTTNINWLPGETRTITWDVAGTDANGINTSNVNILLSTDGGQTFNTVLASNTPNDGSEDIVVPTSTQAAFCRIMVEPVNNVYYAINSEEFSIDTVVNTTCDNFVNTTAVSIPDGVGANQQGPAVQSVINIPNNLTNIDDINVTLDVSHTWMSDLVFQLVNPSGDFIVLWGRNCDNEDGFNVVFNDNGVGLPASGTSCANPLTGIYSPVDTNTDLATIFGSGTQGDWTLVFADFFNGDTGTLNSWEIEICTTTFSVEDNVLNSFTISPNPNSGIFNLNFNQPMRDSQVSIYDLQGRLIESLDIDANTSTQRVELQNQYQSGVYLVEVSNENGKSINKLIIK